MNSPTWKGKILWLRVDFRGFYFWTLLAQFLAQFSMLSNCRGGLKSQKWPHKFRCSIWFDSCRFFFFHSYCQNFSGTMQKKPWNSAFSLGMKNKYEETLHSADAKLQEKTVFPWKQPLETNSKTVPHRAAHTVPNQAPFPCAVLYSVTDGCKSNWHTCSHLYSFQKFRPSLSIQSSSMCVSLIFNPQPLCSWRASADVGCGSCSAAQHGITARPGVG